MTDTVSTGRGLAIIGACLLLAGLAAWGIEWPMQFFGVAGKLIDGALIVAGLGLLVAGRRKVPRDSATRPPAA